MLFFNLANKRTSQPSGILVQTLVNMEMSDWTYFEKIYNMYANSHILQQTEEHQGRI